MNGRNGTRNFRGLADKALQRSLYSGRQQLSRHLNERIARLIEIQSQLQSRGIGHSARMPRRVEHNLHADFFHFWQVCEPLLHVSLQDVRHAASPFPSAATPFGPFAPAR